MLTLLLCDVGRMMIYVCAICSQPTNAGAPEKDQRSGTRTSRSWRLNPNIPTARRRWYCEWCVALLPNYLCFCPFLIDIFSFLVLFCDLYFFILLILCMFMFFSLIIPLIPWFPSICLSPFPFFPLQKSFSLRSLPYIFHASCLCRNEFYISVPGPSGQTKKWHISKIKTLTIKIWRIINFYWDPVNVHPYVVLFKPV